MASSIHAIENDVTHAKHIQSSFPKATHRLPCTRTVINARPEPERANTHSSTSISRSHITTSELELLTNYMWKICRYFGKQLLSQKKRLTEYNTSRNTRMRTLISFSSESSICGGIVTRRVREQYYNNVRYSITCRLTHVLANEQNWNNPATFCFDVYEQVSERGSAVKFEQIASIV